MSGAPVTAGRPADGRASEGLRAFLRREIAPARGRLAASLRLTLTSLVAVVIAETFQTPYPAVTAGLVFFIPARDAAASMRTAALFGVSVIVAVLATLLDFMVSLSQPALRVGLILLTTFGAVFFSRVSRLGPAFFVACTFVSFATATLGDEVLGNALQRGTRSNAVANGVPEILFMSSEEALSQSVLWLGLAFVLPAMLAFIGNGITGDRQKVAAQLGGAKQALFAPDALHNPGPVHFALKVTLAVAICYAIINIGNFPQISTCIVTCLLVTLGGVGETLHKARLRMMGAVLGGALGIGVILTLMPSLRDLGDLLFVLAPPLFAAAWIANGSQHIAYAGQQMALALLLTLLQGYGPTLDMETARNRVIGVLLGNAVVVAVFSLVWPRDEIAAQRHE